MPQMIRRLVTVFCAIHLVVTGDGWATAEPVSEQSPTRSGGTSSRSFGYSEPISAPPGAVESTSAGTIPPTFPYGSPLSYEYQRTCWPHHYCHCRHSTFKARKQCEYWGYPEEFCERPFGVFVRSHFHAQIANGLANQMVLYQYDFYDTVGDEATTLNPHGLVQVAKVGELAGMLGDPFFIVTVEATGDPELDTARRLHVFQKLVELDVPIAVEQVVTGSATSPGLDGIEAFEIYRNQLQQTRVLGGTIGSASNSSAARVPAVRVGVMP